MRTPSTLREVTRPVQSQREGAGRAMGPPACASAVMTVGPYPTY